MSLADPLAVAVEHLLSDAEVEELCQVFAQLAKHPLSVVRANQRGQAAAQAPPKRSLEVLVGGEPAYCVLCEAEDLAVALALQRSLEIAAHHAFSREVTIATHSAAMDQSFGDAKAADERLARSFEAVSEVDRIKASILANVSHELRTPLTAIVGYTELMRDGFVGEVSPEQRNYLTTVLEKAEQLQALITSVLALASASAANDDALANLQLGEIVRSELSTLEPAIVAKSLAITLHIGAADSIMGNATKLRQAVAALLSNAVKFSPRLGQVEVSLTGEQSGELDSKVILQISDSGVGIEPAQLVHIFEPFYQGDASSTRLFGGTGIGLTLVKSVVEAHRGTVTVRSQVGKGTVFRVTLPGKSSRTG